MEIYVFIFLIGLILGVCCTYLKIKSKYRREITKLSQHISYLDCKEKKRLKNSEIYKNKLKQEVVPRKFEWDLGNHQHQLQLVSQSDLKIRNPVNHEAVQYFYYLQNWIKEYKQGWYVAFEVSMGAFVSVHNCIDEDMGKNIFRSYNSKRVDFLVIDNYGCPKFAVEYNGSGHDLSGDAEDRMKVKRLVFKKISIPLIEVSENTNKKDFFKLLRHYL